VEYSVTFGGAKDDVGAVIVAKPKGFARELLGAVYSRFTQNASEFHGR